MQERKPFVVLVAGFSNYKRRYPAYEKKFGKENFSWTTNAKRYTVDEHLDELESIIPRNRKYILVGYSMGASLIIELLSRKKMENCNGVVLIGGARIQPSHWFLNLLFKLPVPVIYMFSIIMALSFPIVLVFSKFNFHKAIPASFEGLYRLIENGAREMKKEYNECIRKVGRNVSDILEENKQIPLLIIRLTKDMMVNDEDLELVKSFFLKKKEKVMPADIIHLTHALDEQFAEIITNELDFFNFSS
ncbi:MAG: hypothetical protein ACTSX6_08845 [Candidatus Heimdallarchaeaceae archaeon]